MVSPITHENNRGRPLIKRLLSNPQWRARYLAHVRTVVNEWLEWEVLGPIVNEHIELIDTEVQQDDKKLYGYDEFKNGAPEDLRNFVNQRREYLLNHPELDRPTPKILSVSIESETDPIQSNPVSVKATLDASVAVDSVLLYYSTERYVVFNEVPMNEARR